MKFVRKLRNRASTGYEASVIRRTLVFSLLIGPAFLANFLLYYVSARLLSADQFGLLYVANTVGNVLYSAVVVINVFFSRHLVLIRQDEGDQAAYLWLSKLVRIALVAGFGVAAIVFVSLLIFAERVGVESKLIILLIVLDAYTAYFADLGRTLLLSLRRTVRLGLYTLAYMVLRLLLCIAGILIWGTVAGALIGVVTSSAVVFLAFSLWLASKTKRREKSALPLPSPLQIAPVIVGYGLLTLIANLDVVLSYLVLSSFDLGIYSASSVFPKAILVVTTPVLQMLFPMMFRSGLLRENYQRVVFKIVGVVLAMTVGGGVMIWLFSGFLCGGRYGFTLCSQKPLVILIASSPPLALLRVLVLLQFARGRDLIASWLLIPALVFGYINFSIERSVEGLAVSFALFTVATLAYFIVLTWVSERR